jgi:hypothetical protein
MKKTLFKLYGFALLLISFALPAISQAPVDGMQTLSSGFTCATGATTNLNWVIDVSRQAYVGLQLKVTYNTATTTNTATFTVQRSVDGVTYDTTQGTPVVLTANGTTQVVTLTNLPSCGARYMKVTTCVNSAGGGISAGGGAYAIKISAP